MSESSVSANPMLEPRVKELTASEFAAFLAAHVPSAIERWEAKRGGRVLRFFSVDDCVVVVESHRGVASQSVVVTRYAIPGVSNEEEAAALRAVLAALITESDSGGVLAVKLDADASDTLAAHVATHLGMNRMDVPVSEAGLDVALDSAQSNRQGWIRWASASSLEKTQAPVYMRQRTDFSCGPASFLMGRRGELDFGAEMELWREATYVMGCEAFGLASAIAARGYDAKVCATTDEPILTDQAGGVITQTAVNAAIQAKLRVDAPGVGRVIGEITPDVLDDVLTAGGYGLALIDLAGPIDDHSAHWILVWGRDGDTFVVHDPWTEPYETWVETAPMPMTREQLWRISQWDGERSFVLVAGS